MKNNIKKSFAGFIPLEKKNSLAGFTLIEIILGLAIFSFIALTLYNTFAGGVKLGRKSEDLNRIYREARWSLDQMTRDLENMVPYDYSSSYPDLLAFSGSNDEFILTLPTEEGLRVVKYSLQKPDYGRIHKTVIGKRYSKNVKMTLSDKTEQSFENLVREQKPFVDHVSAVTGEELEIDVLSSRMKADGLKFQYGDIGDEGDSKINWSDQWVEKNLPAGVRIELTFINKNDDSPVVLQKDVLIPRRMVPKFKTQ